MVSHVHSPYQVSSSPRGHHPPSANPAYELDLGQPAVQDDGSSGGGNAGREWGHPACDTAGPFEPPCLSLVDCMQGQASVLPDAHGSGGGGGSSAAGGLYKSGPLPAAQEHGLFDAHGQQGARGSRKLQTAGASVPGRGSGRGAAPAKALLSHQQHAQHAQEQQQRQYLYQYQFLQHPQHLRPVSPRAAAAVLQSAQHQYHSASPPPHFEVVRYPPFVQPLGSLARPFPAAKSPVLKSQQGSLKGMQQDPRLPPQQLSASWAGPLEGWTTEEPRYKSAGSAQVGQGQHVPPLPPPPQQHQHQHQHQHQQEPGERPPRAQPLQHALLPGAQSDQEQQGQEAGGQKVQPVSVEASGVQGQLAKGLEQEQQERQQQQREQQPPGGLEQEQQPPHGLEQEQQEQQQQKQQEQRAQWEQEQEHIQPPGASEPGQDQRRPAPRLNPDSILQVAPPPSPAAPLPGALVQEGPQSPPAPAVAAHPLNHHQAPPQPSAAPSLQSKEVASGQLQPQQQQQQPEPRDHDSKPSEQQQQQPLQQPALLAPFHGARDMALPASLLRGSVPDPTSPIHHSGSPLDPQLALEGPLPVHGGALLGGPILRARADPAAAAHAGRGRARHTPLYGTLPKRLPARAADPLAPVDLAASLPLPRESYVVGSASTCMHA